MSVTTREEELLEILSSKIRLLAFSQIHETWWGAKGTGDRNCRKRLAELVADNLLVRERVLARPFLPLEKPLVRWRPGQAAPDAASLSWQLHKRWVEPAREVTVYFASRRAVGIFGGESPGQIKNRSQVTHDLHVSALYLKLRRESPTLVKGWVNEDLLAPTRKNQKLPDAILHDQSGTPKLVTEFGGSYPTERVAAFHEDCSERGIPYEIW